MRECLVCHAHGEAHEHGAPDSMLGLLLTTVGM
jgi:hypothetical protein